jgi:hypothetical protein
MLRLGFQGELPGAEPFVRMFVRRAADAFGDDT